MYLVVWQRIGWDIMGSFFKDVRMLKIHEPKKEPCQDLADAMLASRSAMSWIRENLCTSRSYIASVPRDEHPFYRTVFDEDLDEDIKVCYGEYHACISDKNVQYHSWKDSVKDCVDKEKVPAFLASYFSPFSTMPLEDLPRFMSELIEGGPSLKSAPLYSEAEIFTDFIIRFRLDHGV